MELIVAILRTDLWSEVKYDTIFSRSFATLILTVANSEIIRLVCQEKNPAVSLSNSCNWFLFYMNYTKFNSSKISRKKEDR